MTEKDALALANRIVAAAKADKIVVGQLHGRFGQDGMFVIHSMDDVDADDPHVITPLAILVDGSHAEIASYLAEKEPAQ